MYMPGRRRTGSRPSRTRMSLAVYVAAISSVLRPPDLRDAAPLHHLLALSGAPARRHLGHGDPPLAALQRHRDEVLLLAERERAHHAPVRVGPHEQHAPSGTRQ